MLKNGLTLRINATFLIGAALLLAVFAIQHRGVLRTARFQMVIGILVLLPLILIALTPMLSGNMKLANLFPLTPLRRHRAWPPHCGRLGPARLERISRRTLSRGLVDLRLRDHDLLYQRVAVPRHGLRSFHFVRGAPLHLHVRDCAHRVPGHLGLPAMLDPGIYDGSGVAAAMAHMVGGGALISALIVLLLLLALVLSIITAMAGSSRTLYQGSIDGWLPRYLSHVNVHGAPTRAMWTDLGFNLILLLMSDYVFVLAVSNCCYLIFNFLNLNAGWMHRLDSPGAHRPWRAPNVLLALGAVLAFFNAFLLGAGANVYGKAALF